MNHYSVLLMSLLAFQLSCWGLEPPQLLSPADGAVLYLMSPDQPISLGWSKISAAGDYLLSIAGPPSYPSNCYRCPVTIRDWGTLITADLPQMASGTYAWSVVSVTPTADAPTHASVDSPTSTFTVVMQSIDPGPVDPPTIIEPSRCRSYVTDRDLTVEFRWQRRAGAFNYVLDVTPSEQAPLRRLIADPASATEASATVTFPTARRSSPLDIEWTLSSRNLANIDGPPSPTSVIRVYPVPSPRADLTGDGTVDFRDIFALSTDWHDCRRLSDYSLSGLTDAHDLLYLKHSLDNPECEVASPELWTPSPEVVLFTSTTSRGVYLIWYPIEQAHAYECLVLHEDQIFAYELIPAIEIPYYQFVSSLTGTYSWKIRAIQSTDFGAGAISCYSDWSASRRFFVQTTQ